MARKQMDPNALMNAIRERSWGDIRWDEAATLLQQPRSKEFRKLIDSGDRHVLMDLARAQQPSLPLAAPRIALSLLQHTGLDDELKNFYQERWPEVAAEEKVHYLCWRLLDFEDDLDPEWHRRIWQAVWTNFALFLRGVVWWVGGDSANVLDVVRSKLCDKPRPKRWRYLAAACAYRDAGAVRSLISEERHPPDDDFTKQVVAPWLSRPGK